MKLSSAVISANGMLSTVPSPSPEKVSSTTSPLHEPLTYVTLTAVPWSTHVSESEHEYRCSFVSEQQSAVTTAVLAEPVSSSRLNESLAELPELDEYSCDPTFTCT